MILSGLRATIAKYWAVVAGKVDYYTLEFLSSVIDDGHRAKYVSVREAYRGSHYEDRSNQIQTAFWILGSLSSTVVALNVSKSSVLPPLAFVAFAVLALSSVHLVFPLYFVYKEGIVPFRSDWYPLTQSSNALAEARDNVLRLPTREDFRIVAYFDVPGRVEGYNFKIVTSHDEISCEPFPQYAGLSQEIYPDATGIWSKSTIEGDNVFNIYTVRKEQEIHGDPNHYIKFVEVSSIVDEISDTNIEPERAESEGDVLLTIDVTE